MGNAEALTRVADEAFCTGYAELIPTDGERSYLSDRAVGSVRTVGILAGEKKDRAVVEIVWDGRMARATSGGKRRLEKERRLRRSLFVFERTAGRQTSLKTTFTTAHCQNCGAHDAGGTAPACPYCDAPRIGDRSTWLLTRALDAARPDSAELRAELELLRAGTKASAHQPTMKLLAWAGALVRADGEVDAKEKRALLVLGTRNDIDPARIEMMVNGFGDGANMPQPRNTAEAQTWMDELVELALADGVFSRAERRFLRHAAANTGVDRKVLAHSIKRKRSELYRATRRA